METELILLTRIGISLLFLTFLSRFPREWLYSAIAVNLLLITTLGAKTVSFFGFVTNSGNVFYASIVFAIYLLIEHHGKESVKPAIWMAAVFSAYALLMGELVVNTLGTADTRVFDDAMFTLLKIAPRLALGSIVAFIVSQHINVALYTALSRRSKGGRLWFRNIASVIVTQFVDSVLFFAIAFLGVLAPSLVLQSMIVGFILKVAIGIISTPFLYLSLRLKKE